MMFIRFLRKLTNRMVRQAHHDRLPISVRPEFIKGYEHFSTLQKISIISLLITCYTSLALPATFSLMLDPHGDAKNTGRKIGESFERGLTLQCCEKLKSILEERHPFVKVVLTRLAGETVAPLQNAHFANRLTADLYINVSFYHETSTQPKLFIYTLAYGNECSMPADDIAFYSIDKAHWPYHKNSMRVAKNLLKHLQHPIHNKLFFCAEMYTMPFKPLIGIKAPAVALEIGLKDESDWQNYVDDLANGIGQEIITMYKQEFA